MPSMQRTTPSLWFDTQAEDAANFHKGSFASSQILHYRGRLGDGRRAMPTLLGVTTLDIEGLRNA